MIITNLTREDGLVKPTYVSNTKMESPGLKIYDANSEDVVGVELGEPNINIYAYPFTDVSSMPSERDFEEMLNKECQKGKRILFDFKRKRPLERKYFSNFIHMKYSQSKDFPIFLFDDDDVVYYISSPTPPEIALVNVLTQLDLLCGKDASTEAGRRLATILSMSELDFGEQIYQTTGTYSLPRLKAGKNFKNDFDLKPLREFAVKVAKKGTINNSMVFVKDDEDEEEDGEIYLSDILASESGIDRILDEITVDISINVDISQDVFKSVTLTVGGVLIELQPGSKYTKEEIESMLGTERIIIVYERENSEVL